MHEQRLEVQRDLLRQGDQARRCENCVGLPMSTSKFTKFTQEQYDSLYASIVDGTLAIDDSYDADVSPRSPPSRLTTRADKALKV